MKIRNGFVSNSSSTSFVVISAGSYTILEDGNLDSDLESCSIDLDIDDLIKSLLEAKKNGALMVKVTYGSGYDG